ncbi:zinc ABC transporter ATP-binding protein AztA [Nocardia iowensis]|uniref:Metal ABC transporter ATP-binding protein n=1 Tax=Nocardia iowensis TaxID=204891 RepID=A0ABX8RYW4_NOCIO|nr:zinc ABC transporter ATP-binding protein AztA [Nocardia iowensis]QXN94167.1 metal ABC transporter ATP-binding protein [Nocardia iowensis]
MGHIDHPAAIHISGLSAGYSDHLVLHDVTATIPLGQVTALVGPNGSGKSTLLGVLAGVVTPQEGVVRHQTSGRPAFVVQHSAVPTTLPLTVRETVAMGRWAHRGPWRRLSRHDHSVVETCMARMDIGDLARRRLDSLSGGQRQRTLLAQALAQESELLLLDEPAAGLDSATQQEISRALTEISGNGVTVVQATHDLAEAMRADHCLLLRDGRVLAEGRPQTVLAEHNSVAYAASVDRTGPAA